jgi:hypothetical protein
VILKQFTAREVVSRCDVLEAHYQATASLAAQFLDTLKAPTPFPIRALQVDGGSEFYEVTECAWIVEQLNQQLIEWEHIYNTIRPHQSLNYLTPLQFLQQKGIVPKNPPSVLTCSERVHEVDTRLSYRILSAPNWWIRGRSALLGSPFRP